MIMLWLLIVAANVVCWIIEIVVAFKKGDGPLLGILSIIPCFNLGGLVVGWINVSKWGIMPLMVIWSVLFVLQLITAAFVDEEFLKMIMQSENASQ